MKVFNNLRNIRMIFKMKLLGSILASVKSWEDKSMSTCKLITSTSRKKKKNLERSSLHFKIRMRIRTLRKSASQIWNWLLISWGKIRLIVKGSCWKCKTTSKSGRKSLKKRSMTKNFSISKPWMPNEKTNSSKSPLAECKPTK